MKLLISLLCLASASAMKNERTPTINIDSNASSSSFGEVLLQAKAATFLEMAGSTDDHYALLESLKIDPKDVSDVKGIIKDKILADVETEHKNDQSAIDTIVAKFPCPYANKDNRKTAAELQVELNNLNDKTPDFQAAKTAAETGSITESYDFAIDTDGSKLKTDADSQATTVFNTYAAAKRALEEHEAAVAAKTTEHANQVKLEAEVKQQCECDAKSEYETAVEGIKTREATRKRDHPLFGFLTCILEQYEADAEFATAKGECSGKNFPTTSVEIDYKEGEMTTGMDNCASAGAVPSYSLNVGQGYTCSWNNANNKWTPKIYDGPVDCNVMGDCSVAQGYELGNPGKTVQELIDNCAVGCATPEARAAGSVSFALRTWEKDYMAGRCFCLNHKTTQCSSLQGNHGCPDKTACYNQYDYNDF